jgi:hypothetical protein
MEKYLINSKVARKMKPRLGGTNRKPIAGWDLKLISVITLNINDLSQGPANYGPQGNSLFYFYK